MAQKPLIKFPVFEPQLSGEESRFVTKAIAEKHLSGTSPTIAEFEKKFSSFQKTPFTCAVANGTVAIRVALHALGVKPGDEVIVPDLTIISNPLAVVESGAKPVFVDAAADDWCLDVSKIESKITPKTVGIMAVHLFGHSCDMDALRALCEKHRLWLLEDNAQGMGGLWETKPLGNLGTISTYSFYANKLITTGEGGAITTEHEALHKRCLVLRNLGFDPRPEYRFIHCELTSNYRMSSLQAAFGIGQLEKVDQFIKARNKVYTMYREAIGHDPRFIFQKAHVKNTPIFWMLALVLSEGVKKPIESVLSELAQEGIETRRLFYPLHLQPVLTQYHSQSEEVFKVSENVFERGFYLPSSTSLKWDDIQGIVQKLKAVSK